MSFRAACGRGPIRVGLFGLLGAGNVGNDGSMEVVLDYLRTAHPDATVDAMCSGADAFEARFGIGAVPLLWSQRFEGRVSGVPASLLKGVGKVLDAGRTAAWVHRHDVVIVPGAGILEATLPTNPWGLPYSLLLLCLWGRLLGTRVALVGVGANVMSQRVTRALSTLAARLAFYRSYRDILSFEAMRIRGIDGAGDHVFPDLIMGYPAPDEVLAEESTVGVGVMAYYGNNDHRRSAERIHAHYVRTMQRFVLWLLDNGYRVRLFAGDGVFDDRVIAEIEEFVTAKRGRIEPPVLAAAPTATMADVMDELAQVRTVVATRYHNVMGALRLSKPTISVGYAEKHEVLMADMGLPEFCLSVHDLDLDRLIGRFKELQDRRVELRATLLARNVDKRREVERHFAELSSVLFGGASAERRRTTPRPKG